MNFDKYEDLKEDIKNEEKQDLHDEALHAEMNDINLLELIDISHEIDEKIKASVLNLEFNVVQNKIYDVKVYFRKIIDKLEKEEKYTENLNSCGFSVVQHDRDRFSILNYSLIDRDTVSADDYYGFDYTLKDGLVKRNDRVTDDDYNAVYAIITGTEIAV